MDVVAAKTFKFATHCDAKRCTEGQWFTVLEFERYDGVVCNVLLVDSEGLGDPGRQQNPATKSIDSKLFFVARTLSQIAMLHLDLLLHLHPRGYMAKLFTDAADDALSDLPPGVRKATQTVQYFVTLKVRL